MSRKSRLLVGVLAFIVMTSVAVGEFSGAGQSNDTQPGFSQAMIYLNNAEAAGATQAEVAPLVELLNNALDLNVSAQQTSDPTIRMRLLNQENQTLVTVENQAKILTTVAAQRTRMSRLLSYVGAAIAAAIGTILYACGVTLRRQYRIKRALRMRFRVK